ncbi:MAG: hypothetical protein M5U26_12015 [Planctomycetota bacterium]|nr:hypothetical protein [Planctomycetota bacterium]
MDYTKRQALEADIETGLRAGRPIQELIDGLVAQGWTQDDAGRLVARIFEKVHPGKLAETQKREVRGKGVFAMKLGALGMIIGLGLTLMSYMQTRQSGGSGYLSFYGLAFGGFVVFLSGLYQWVFGREIE